MNIKRALTWGILKLSQTNKCLSAMIRIVFIRTAAVTSNFEMIWIVKQKYSSATRNYNEMFIFTYRTSSLSIKIFPVGNGAKPSMM